MLAPMQGKEEPSVLRLSACRRATKHPRPFQVRAVFLHASLLPIAPPFKQAPERHPSSFIREAIGSQLSGDGPTPGS